MVEDGRQTDELVVQAALTFYESARAELIARIGQRDQAIVLYLGAVAALSGFAAQESTLPASLILAVAGLLAWGAAELVVQHNSVIGYLAVYCARDLNERLASVLPDVPPQWDNSPAQEPRRQSFYARRRAGHVVLIPAPGLLASLASLLVAAHAIDGHGGVWDKLWWTPGLAGVTASMRALVLVLGSAEDRRRAAGLIPPFVP